MGLATFKGGIHPYEGKDLSEDKTVQILLPKGELVYPMLQHMGAPAKPLVTKGDNVLVGQIIGEGVGFISANVISSVSGTVKIVESRLTKAGTMAECVVVENDNQYNTIEGFGTKRDYTKLKKEEIRSIIKEAGLVGMGGAGFPVHVKLTPKVDENIEYVIVNGAECEPYLTSDYRMMIEKSEQIVGGLEIILTLFGNAKGIIAIEDNKPKAIAKLKQITENNPRISVCAVKTKYPQGGERTLIYATTGYKINSSMLPSDVGCIVNNTETVVSIYMAVCETTPLVTRTITVTGDAIAAPNNFNVRIGTGYEELVTACGGFISEPKKLISGGPLMGVAIYSLHIPVIKTSSALLCFTEDEVAEFEPSPCIRCGRCVDVCPGRVIPQKLMEYAQRYDNAGFEALDGMECCECGCCSYICPAKRQLTQAFRQSRKGVLDNRRKRG